MKMENSEILYRLQSDLDGANSAYNQVISEVENWEREIKGKYAKPGEGHGVDPTASDKSGLMMQDLRRVVEGSIPAISEPFLAGSDMVGIFARSAESVEKAGYLEQLLNKQFSKGTRRVSLVEGLARDIQEQGTVFIKSGWGDNMPVVEQVNIKEIVIDPSARTLEDAKFVVQRRKLSISDILSNPDWFGKHTLEELQALGGFTDTEYDPDDNNGYGQDTSYNYDDKSRELVEIFEYYGMMDITGDGTLEPVLGIWGNGLLLKFGVSPYPPTWRGNPFDSAVYISRSFNIYGDSIASLIGDYQKIRTGFMREIMNNANAANTTQTAVRKGSIDVANKRKFLNGESYEYVGEPGIVLGQFNEIPASIFQIVEQFKIEEEELSGISRQNAGVDTAGMMNKTATAANIANTNADKRLQQIVRHMADMFESMFRKWIDLNQMMLQGGSVKPMARNQMMGNQPNQEISVDGNQLHGKYDLELQVGTASMVKDQNNNILMMLQQIQAQAQHISPSVSVSLLSQLAGNIDMPGLAEQLGATAEQMMAQEQSGQPSEQEQIAKQTAMLEMEKLNSEIDENNASAMKDQASAVGTQVETQLATYGIDSTIN